MSTRTIIEINHDYANDLLTMPAEMFRGLIMQAALKKAHDQDEIERQCISNGIDILGSRHHSDYLTVRTTADYGRGMTMDLVCEPPKPSNV